MLHHLHIENYALINRLDIDFGTGLSTITGETGAGKSILLGALSLILGRRADTSVLFDKNKKCVVEGSFGIQNYGLDEFFISHDIDYDDISVLRREISVSGKSRAFINDIPVTLEIMTELGNRLIDIHSQYQSLSLSNNQFQMKVVDIFAGNSPLLEEYMKRFQEFLNLQHKIGRLTEESEKSKSDLDYYQFQFNQLEEAHLREGEQEEMEQELEKLVHAEEIKTSLTAAGYLLQGDGASVISLLKDIISQITSTARYINEVSKLKDRAESSYIELRDIARELGSINENIYIDQERLNAVKDRLDIIYALEKKHHASDIQSLVNLRENLFQKLNEIGNYDEQLEALQKEFSASNEITKRLALELTAHRSEVLPSFEEKVTSMLREMAMPNASFKILLESNGGLTNSGADRIQFLFSANKNMSPQEISKVASGGELSRLMLAIKSLMSDSAGLPTVIFDEIDTGVSGEVAVKVGNIIRRMSLTMQIINITHLPQIASKGDNHFLVFKNEKGETPVTGIKLLTDEERRYEIARMLSGEEITGAALENAKILLGSK